MELPKLKGKTILAAPVGAKLLLGYGDGCFGDCIGGSKDA